MASHDLPSIPPSTAAHSTSTNAIAERHKVSEQHAKTSSAQNMNSSNGGDTKSQYTMLNARALLFCKSFLNSTPPPEMLSHHFTTKSDPIINEHCSLPPSGSPLYKKYASTLPFLANSPFTGRDACLEYFTQLSNVLAVDWPSPIPHKSPGTHGTAVSHPGKFASGRTFMDQGEPVEPFEILSVDEQKKRVTVRGKAHFSSVKTKKGWDEEFVYVLTLVHERSDDHETTVDADAPKEEMPGQWEKKGEGVVEKVKSEELSKDVAVQKMKREQGWEGVDDIRIQNWEIWADPLAAYWACCGDEQDHVEQKEKNVGVDEGVGMLDEDEKKPGWNSTKRGMKEDQDEKERDEAWRREGDKLPSRH